MPQPSSPLSYFTYASAYGPLTIQASHEGITALVFDAAPLSGQHKATALTNLAATELHEYLAGKRFDFETPLDMQGTNFQKMVWRETVAVPYGNIVTARDIALRIDRPDSYRSVGTALSQCPLAPFVPVHRIELPKHKHNAELYLAFRALEQR